MYNLNRHLLFLYLFSFDTFKLTSPAIIRKEEKEISRRLWEMKRFKIGYSLKLTFFSTDSHPRNGIRVTEIRRQQRVVYHVNVTESSGK